MLSTRWLQRLALLFISLFGTGVAYADTVVLGADWSYPPHQFLNQNNQPDGFDIDIFRAVASDQGLEPRFEMGDWANIQAQLNEGRIDVVPMFISERRRQDYAFTMPIMREYYVLFARRGIASYQGLGDLDRQAIAVQRNGFIWHYVQSHYPALNLVSTDTEPAAIQAVVENKAQLALVSIHVGTYVVARNHYRDIIQVSPPLVSADYAFAVPYGNEQLLAALNQGIANILANGTYDRIYKTWVSNLDAVYQAYRLGWVDSLWIILPLMIAVILLVVLFLRFKWLVHKLRRWANIQLNKATRAEERVERLSQFDSITSLPKRRLFENNLEAAIAKASRKGGEIGVAFITVSDVNKIQQIAGFSAAARIIRTVAERLFNYVGESTYISHFGGGVFAMLVSDHWDCDQIYNCVYKAINEAEVRVEIEDYPVDVSLNCGLAIYPYHGKEAAQLTRAAEIACSYGRVKRNNLVTYDAGMEPDPRQISLMPALKDAIEKDMLGWVFQPIYSIRDQQITSAEMLVRWQHSQYGPIPPNLFIPLAEETGTIRLLTRHVIQKAGQFCRDWQSRGLDLRLSINVSGNDLADPGLIREILTDFRDVSHRLILEVTETAAMEDVAAITENIDRLRQHGVGIALDDYGTGYSSLIHIRSLQPDELKIDQDFIKTLCESAEDEKIVAASIRLGHELGARVIAEGVESQEVFLKLQSMGCDAVQGYGIAFPMPAYQFIRFCEHPTPLFEQSQQEP